MKSKKIVSALLLAGLTGLAATAQAQTFIGGSLGRSEVKEDCGGVACDKTDTGFKIFGGHMYTPNFGVELGWVDLGKATLSAAVPPFGTARAEIESSGVGLWAVGALPLDKSFSLFAKAGVASLKTEITASITGLGSASDDDTSTTFAWGIGAGWNFDRNLGVRVEYERFKPEYENEKYKVDLFSVGLVYRF